jgi:hypothetical protein
VQTFAVNQGAAVGSLANGHKAGSQSSPFPEETLPALGVEAATNGGISGLDTGFHP